MSQFLINQYLNELQSLRKISGTPRETVVREPFKDLLKAWGKNHELQFVAEYQIVTPAKNLIYADGALVYSLRVPFGYWEAKDEQDDLDKEITKKFKKGYPRDNIIFEDSSTAALIQNGADIMRCKVDDPQRLEKLLKLFFAYERPEIAEFRNAVAQFKADLPAVLSALREMIDTAEAANMNFRHAQAKFLKHAKETINPAVTEADVREMLIQHILTEEIFSKVFDESDFHRKNNVARELYALEAEFFTGAVKKNTLKGLEPYYAAIRAAAALISTHGEKQAFLKVIYENFYKVYNPKAADRLGVIYTPNEIVRFMVESADWLCQKHFDKCLIDKGVEILDPAAGTGTFVTELLEHFRGQPKKLAQKYKDELHANEVAILPYYVANLNIEATYAAITGQYVEFENLCFVNTLDNVAGLGKFSGYQGELFGAMSEENIERIKRQNKRKISVIIGNPPYNAWQENYNSRNPNRLYRRVDDRIQATYSKSGTAQNKNSVYDTYTRFFRWASDRIKDEGVIAFISNRNFIEKAAFDGFRKCVAREFSEIWLVDLGGDVRANPKISGTKHNVFGIQTGVTISFLVRRKDVSGSCRIFYARRPEFDSAEDKLAFLSASRMSSLDVIEVKPNAKSDWINQTENDFETFVPIAAKDATAIQSTSQDRAIFRFISNGLKSQRDEWVFDFDRGVLRRKMRFFTETYERACESRNTSDQGTIKWDRELDRYLAKRVSKTFDQCQIVRSQFRPFVRKWLYFDRHFNAMTYQLPSLFRDGNATNTAIAFLGVASANPFAVLASHSIFDLGYLKNGNGGTQGVSRYRYTADSTRLDNITDWALEQFRAHYESRQTESRSTETHPHPEEGSQSEPVSKDGQAHSEDALVLRDAASGGSSGRGLRTKAPRAAERAITKDAIFHYIYGVLHDPVYREKYAQNLKREFPRIPFYPDFWAWADWGAELMRLHIGYEKVEPWPLSRTYTKDEKAATAGLAPKTLLKADKEHGII
ncbi:MAG: type ISP restriction/modification enzyme, partial [Methylocella sp.]